MAGEILSQIFLIAFSPIPPILVSLCGHSATIIIFIMDFAEEPV